MGNDRQPAVVDRQFQAVVEFLELILQLRADESAGLERKLGTGLDVYRRAPDQACYRRITVDAYSVTVFGILWRHDGAQEMVLNRTDPAVARFDAEWPVGHQIVAIEFLRFFAVVNDRPIERIGIYVEHRALDFVRASLDLGVLGTAPIVAARIGQRLRDVNAITAARQANLFLETQALPVAPGERHDEFVVTAERIARRRGGEFGKVIWFGPITLCN